MVFFHTPQGKNSSIEANTNYPPQSSSGGPPSPTAETALVQTGTLRALVQTGTLTALIQTGTG